jgi:hypothetical protein
MRLDETGSNGENSGLFKSPSIPSNPVSSRLILFQNCSNSIQRDPQMRGQG